MLAPTAALPDKQTCWYLNLTLNCPENYEKINVTSWIAGFLFLRLLIITFLPFLSYLQTFPYAPPCSLQIHNLLNNMFFLNHLVCGILL